MAVKKRKISYYYNYFSREWLKDLKSKTKIIVYPFKKSTFIFGRKLWLILKCKGKNNSRGVCEKRAVERDWKLSTFNGSLHEIFGLSRITLETSSTTSDHAFQNEKDHCNDIGIILVPSKSVDELCSWIDSLSTGEMFSASKCYAF